MDSLLWGFKSDDAFVIVFAIVVAFLIDFLLINPDFIFLPIIKLFQTAWKGPYNYTPSGINLPAGLIIIPSLLRNQDDFDGFISSIESCGNNEYPNHLTIIASVDGNAENPKLYRQLVEWVSARHYDNVTLYVSHNEVRRGKIMAIESAVQYMKSLISDGKVNSFPELYFAVDADTSLGAHALEHLVIKLLKRHWLTGNPKKAVAGKICSHPDQLWQGWRALFTIRGQIYINAAWEFLVYGTRRYNLKMIPWIALPGLLYVTWSDVLIESPRFMGYLQSIKFIDWLRWMMGYSPPSFSKYTGESLPQALCGSTDDTTIALIVSCATWKEGKLSFDAPQTPLHAIGRVLLAWFIERSNAYAPEARAFTFVPPTPRGLWLQRLRWNSCRVECSGRFSKAFWFHWNSAVPFLSQLSIVIFGAMRALVVYVILPFMLFGDAPIIYYFVFGYLFCMVSQFMRTIIALYLENERHLFWRVIFALPTYSLYTMIFGFMTTTWGVIKDVCFYGCNVRFVPEDTLIKGRSQRIAILYRVRRFFSLCFRSLLKGDVPFGMWWFGWYGNEYVDNGFKGWTSGKKSQYILK